jgi:hypothetical protein
VKNYIDVPNKRAVQGIALSPYKRIFGLGGPNINNYISILRKRGFKEIVSFENNWNIYLRQKRQNPKCELVYGNILEYTNYDAFYDYDFCNYISTMKQWLPIIVNTKRYSATFSLRGIGINKTINTFRRYGEASYIKYKDTSPMITFFNNQKQ